MTLFNLAISINLFIFFYIFAPIIRGEKIWCTFVSCTKHAPNIHWRGTRYCAPSCIAKFWLCTNYTPDKCSVFCNLLGNKNRAPEFQIFSALIINESI